MSMISKVAKQQEALKVVEALYFEANNKPLLEIGGAGGLQYLSEAIANQDTKLLRSIDKRKGGALIGIFSLGGGTGSGSLFALLTKYKNIVQRYTVGVGILPLRQNVEEFSNAGRYLTKYLGNDHKKRFHTLILFSNEAANNVLIDEASQEDGSEPLTIMNEYISAFIHDFSMINENKTITKFGKLFDPMDGKRFLAGVCTIGYCSSENFSAKDFFIRAICPMSYEDRSLQGLAVRVTQQEHGRSVDLQVSDLVRRIVEALDGDKPADEEISALRAITPFYRTIKAVRIFYFIKNTSYQRGAFAFQRTISRFFQTVSGARVSISTNCYFAPASESRDNSILVVLRGAFNFEIYESVMRYAQRSFIKKGDVEPNFRKAFNEKLGEIKRTEILAVDAELEEGVEDVLADTNCNVVEGTEEKESVEMFSHPDLRDVIDAQKLEQILLKRETLKATLVEIAKNFALGESGEPPEDDIFSGF